MYVCTRMSGKTHTHTARRTVARNERCGRLYFYVMKRARMHARYFRAQPAVAENQLTDGDICEHGENAESCDLLLICNVAQTVT